MSLSRLVASKGLLCLMVLWSLWISVEALAYLDMHPFMDQEWNKLHMWHTHPQDCMGSTSSCLLPLNDSAFPSESKEHHGHWVGISENVSHFMTFKVLANDTLKVIQRSNICSAHDPTAKNLHLDPLNEDFPEIDKSLRQQSGQDVDSPASDHGETDAHTWNLTKWWKCVTPMNVSNTSTPPMAVVDPQDLVGCTFLMDECDHGQCFHVKIVKCICDHESASQDPNIQPSEIPMFYKQWCVWKSHLLQWNNGLYSEEHWEQPDSLAVQTYHWAPRSPEAVQPPLHGLVLQCSSHMGEWGDNLWTS